MVTLATLNTLAGLEQEMARAGRVAEQRALHAALCAFASPASGYLTTGAAAAALGVSIPTVKRWIQRGVLHGVSVGSRWLISQECSNRAPRRPPPLPPREEGATPPRGEPRPPPPRRGGPSSPATL